MSKADYVLNTLLYKGQFLSIKSSSNWQICDEYLFFNKLPIKIIIGSAKNDSLFKEFL